MNLKKKETEQTEHTRPERSWWPFMVLSCQRWLHEDLREGHSTSFRWKNVQWCIDRFFSGLVCSVCSVSFFSNSSQLWFVTYFVLFLFRITRLADRKEFLLLNTKFYTKLKEEGAAYVGNWIKKRKINVLEKKMIYMPSMYRLLWSFHFITCSNHDWVFFLFSQLAFALDAMCCGSSILG